jgi:hypothetical protein
MISLITLAVVLLLVIGLNVTVQILGERHNLGIDLSKEKYYSISDQTIDVLEGLQEDVYIYTLYRTGNIDETIARLSGNYAAASSFVHYENIDPTLEPGFTRKYDPGAKGISEGSMIITNQDASLYKVLTVFDLYRIDTSTMTAWAILAEQRMTSAINFLKTGIAPSIKLLAGHEEYTMAQLGELTATLQGNGYDVQSYDYMTAGKPLDPMLDTLVVVSPKIDLPDDEYEMIRAFLTQGGRAVFLLDYVVMDASSGMYMTIRDHLNNFNALLMMYNVQVNRDYILGGRPDKILNRPGALIPDMYGHPITNGMIEQGRPPVLSDVSSLTISGQEPASAVLLQTDSDTWAKDIDVEGSMQIDKKPEDREGPFTIAALGEIGDSRIAVFGTSSFVQSGTEIGRSSNRDLIINTINSLARTGTDINISAKLMISGTITLASEAQKTVLLIIVVAVIPLAVFAFGLIVWLRRKRM